jgi:NitT/TauT family transport system substrate-binding protein
MSKRTSSRAGFLQASVATMGLAVVPQIVRAQTLAPLVIAAIPSDISGEAYYAADEGIFKRHGIDARFEPFTNGASISAAIAGGAADVGYSNVISLAIAHTRGLPFTILAPANLHVSNAPTAGILAVKKTSPISSGKDLEGKIVAVIGINNIADIATRAWIEQHGGDPSKVKFVELPFAEMSAAVAAGRVDCASLDVTGDTTLGKADDPLRRLGSAFDAVSNHFAPSVWFSTSEWVAKHPALAKAVVESLRETAVWANTHRRESAIVLAKYTKQAPDAYLSIVRATYGERITPELIAPNIEAAAKFGVIKSAFPASDLIATIPG